MVKLFENYAISHSLTMEFFFFFGGGRGGGRFIFSNLKSIFSDLKYQRKPSLAGKVTIKVSNQSKISDLSGSLGEALQLFSLESTCKKKTTVNLTNQSSQITLKNT